MILDVLVSWSMSYDSIVSYGWSVIGPKLGDYDVTVGVQILKIPDN